MLSPPIMAARRKSAASSAPTPPSPIALLPRQSLFSCGAPALPRAAASASAPLSPMQL